MERISGKLADRLVSCGAVEEWDRDFYRYAIESLIIYAINLTVMTGLALGFGIVPECCVFIAFFQPLRTNCGGFHLKKWYTCCAASCILVCLITVLSDFIVIGWTAMPFSIALCQICIWKMAPCVHENHPLNAEEQRRCRRMARAYSVVLWGVVIALKVMGLEKWAMLGWSGQMVNVVLMGAARNNSQ